MRYRISILLLALSVLGSACTSARWMIRDRQATDPDEYRKVGEEYFLRTAADPDRQSPLLTLNLYAGSRHEYNSKILYERTLQEYRPRAGYVIAGALGAGLGIYLGNSERLAEGRSAAESVIYTAAGGMAALAGFLNMKPAGEPRPTGERQLVNRPGSVVKTDTVRMRENPGVTADLSIFYGEERVYRESGRSLERGVLEIGLGERLAGLNLRGSSLQEVRVEVSFADSLYTWRMPATQLLTPYARVTVPATGLHSSMNIEADNVLAELAEGSRLALISTTPEDRWYRVRYGLSENYLLRSDAEITWDTAGGENRNRTVSVPRIPFGEVDVENNIPILAARDTRNRALVVTNEHYPAPWSSRTYTHRDGRLIRTYLENALGFYSYAVTHRRDVSGKAELRESLGRLRDASSDSTRLFVYLAGYAEVSAGENIEISYMLSPAGADTATPSSMSLGSILDQIASIPSSRKTVVLDLSFRPAGGSLPEDRLDLEQPLRTVAGKFLRSAEETGLFVSSELNQGSGVYLGEGGVDRKHRIFTYFFSRALQERHSRAGQIQQYLERNVSYTSRRLHDRPQEPRFFGNSAYDLAGGQ